VDTVGEKVGQIDWDMDCRGSRGVGLGCVYLFTRHEKRMVDRPRGSIASDSADHRVRGG
jgi:hypothetical protein